MYNEKEVKYRKWKFSDLKEVKKVNRPYFEMKVVKVKKEEKEWTPDCCPCCGAKREWVNDENLDKIQFPCFCRYSKNQHGIITKTYIGEHKETIYTLHGIERQFSSLSSIKSYDKLRRLIEAFDIHILKGKIIIFEEEE